MESEEAPIKIQKVTLPETGKVIKARGNSLKQAFALVQAWNKTAKNMMNQVFSEERDIKTRDQLDVDPDKSVIVSQSSNQITGGAS